MLDEIFATRPLAEWGDILDRAGMWWAPVQTTTEVIEDPQAIAARRLRRRPARRRRKRQDGRLAGRFLGHGVVGAAPPRRSCGQQTEEILLELGYDWDAIGRLRGDGALG